MPKTPLTTIEDSERQEHLLDLQHRANELVDDDLSFLDPEQMPTKLQAQYREHITAFEKTEWVTSFDQLVRRGIELPAPEQLDDSQLSAKLWQVIRGLAMLRTFLYSTGHLSDRELYEELWHELLRDEIPDKPIGEDSAYHIDLVGSGSEQDNEIYLRYYADEEERQRWAKNWPNDAMPEHEALPYGRDRHLPIRNQ